MTTATDTRRHRHALYAAIRALRAHFRAAGVAVNISRRGWRISVWARDLPGVAMVLVVPKMIRVGTQIRSTYWSRGDRWASSGNLAATLGAEVERAWAASAAEADLRRQDFSAVYDYAWRKKLWWYGTQGHADGS